MLCRAYIYSEIELSSPDEEGLLDVSGNYVLVAPRCIPVPGRPFLYLRQFANEEDAHTLALGTGFHYPQRFPLFYLYATKLFHEKWIISWQREGNWYYLVNFRTPTRPFHFFTILFYILDHQIFSGKFIVIWEMVYKLILPESHHD